MDKDKERVNLQMERVEENENKEERWDKKWIKMFNP